MSLFDNNNLGPFIFTFLPAFFYAMLIASFSKCVYNWKKMLLYFTIGTTGVFLAADLIPFVFPNWRSRLNDNEIIALFTFTMVQVALLEELIKFSIFKVVNTLDTKEESPTTTMFYCVCVSCGFAVAENLIYATHFGTYVLLMRAFTAIPMHITFGIIMGYFIALGRINTGMYKIESFFKRISYTSFGILAATFLHGVYDFVGLTSQGEMDKIWWIVLFSIAGSYSLIKDLIIKSNNV